MKSFLKRILLRIILCEPEEWAELRFCMVRTDADIRAWNKRRERYEFAFGKWEADKYTK